MPKRTYAKYGFFCPDDRKNAFDEADAAYFAENGVSYLILDIDNTIEPYENAEPGERAIAWFSMLKEQGIKAAFVSNNNPERVKIFNKDLSLPFVAHAGKPFAFGIRKAMKMMGAEREKTMLLGDQIFTDVLGAHNAGIRVLTVPPIRDKRDILTRFKRRLEKPIMKSYERKKKG